MNRELAIEYEVFKEEGEVVLSVVDKEKDEVLNKLVEQKILDNSFFSKIHIYLFSTLILSI